MVTLPHRLALGSVAAVAGFLFTLAPASAGDSTPEPLLSGDRTVAAGREGGRGAGVGVDAVVGPTLAGVTPAAATLGLVTAGFGAAVARSLYLRRLEQEP